MPGFGKTIAGLEAISGGLDSVKSKAEATAPALAKTRQAVTEAQGIFDELARMFELSQATQNNFSKDFELDMQRVRLGVISLDQYIAKWGDASIATEDGFRTIRESFSGADFGQYREQLQDLIGDITSGAAEVGDIVKFLKENAGDLAKGLVNVLELFQAGKASLEDVQRTLDATKAAFPGTDSDALAEAIRNQLLGGDLGGQV